MVKLTEPFSKIHPWWKIADEFAGKNDSWIAIKFDSPEYHEWAKYFEDLGWTPYFFREAKNHPNRLLTLPCKVPQWLPEIPPWVRQLQVHAKSPEPVRHDRPSLAQLRTLYGPNWSIGVNRDELSEKAKRERELIRERLAKLEILQWPVGSLDARVETIRTTLTGILGHPPSEAELSSVLEQSQAKKTTKEQNPDVQ